MSAEPTSRASAVTAATHVQYCTFWVDDLYLGLDALSVQEVLRNPGLTPVPLAPPAVRGLINLRGQIVTAIDLGAQLGRQAAPRRMSVVVRTPEGSMSLLVDRIDDVVQVPRAEHEPVPPTLTSVARDHVVATCALADRLLLVLDLSRIANQRPGEAA